MKLNETITPVKSAKASQQALFNEVKKLPLSPGVYQFIGVKNEILYIGRATSLRRRVSQYFRPNLDPRIKEMVSLAKKLKHFKTDSVLEAVILEANLIKKHWPKYNVKDKDNRSFVWLTFTESDYPKPIIIRERELSRFPKKAANLFGPFPSQYLLSESLKIIRRIFPYSICQPNSGRACFDYQIGRCPGTCIGQISAKDYQKNIKNIKLLLAGKKKALLKIMAKNNPSAAAALKNLNDVVLISKSELIGQAQVNRIEAYDISHFSGKETIGAMSVMSDSLPDKGEYRLFNISLPNTNDDLRSLEEMISRRLNHLEWPLPDIFLIDGGRPQIAYLAKIFKERRIARPVIGLSKFGGDRLVFSVGASKAVKQLAENLKPILLLARDEAHRFGNFGRKRKMKIRQLRHTGK